MTTATKTNSNGQPRKTLASQIDRLDNILDGLDAALSGAVQDAVEQAVKQAVQAVLTEVLTNRELHEQLKQAAQAASAPEAPPSKPSRMSRLWQTAMQQVRRAAQLLKEGGHGVGMALLTAGGLIAGNVYAARRPIMTAASAVYGFAKTLLSKAGTALARLLPLPVYCSA